MGSVTAVASASLAETDILPRHSIAVHNYGNDAPWFERNIPFFECSDAELTQIYYYRWQLYKAHLKDLGGRGYIVTEFLDDVGWAFNPYQSLDDATAFHINEGRWLRDSRYMDDYITFMFSGANDRHFSDAIAAASYGRFLVDGDRKFAVKNLAGMKNRYESWADHYDGGRGLYFIWPLADATEYSIASIDASGGKDGFMGGNAFRPTFNSFMYGNALAISRLCEISGDSAGAEIYAAKASALKERVQAALWNDSMQHFVDRYKDSNEFVREWDIIRGRELAGYVPWVYGLPDDSREYDPAWTHLQSAGKFAGPHGLRTVEPSYEYYMHQFRYITVNGKQVPECQWNGPSWPFDTTLVLQAMANLLNDYSQDVVCVNDYVRLLKQYARQHLLNGKPDLQEDYDADTGKVIVGLDRSHHYNHSAFNDLIINGLVGLRPKTNDEIEINPLIPADANSSDSIDYFCLENVLYHGHNVTILYDRTGKRYGRGIGLQVFVDGQQVLAPTAHWPVTIAIAPASIQPGSTETNLAVNFRMKWYPVASASVNNTEDALRKAVDGRVWFFPEAPNYWTNAGSSANEDWFGIDFGVDTKISSVKLYFYAGGNQFKAPEKVRIQCWKDGEWVEIEPVQCTPLTMQANGENTIAFVSTITSKVRVVFENPKPATVALVEIKAFE